VGSVASRFRQRGPIGGAGRPSPCVLAGQQGRSGRFAKENEGAQGQSTTRYGNKRVSVGGRLMEIMMDGRVIMEDVQDAKEVENQIT